MALHNETGKLGEALVRAILAQAGPVEHSAVADVRFAGLEIEVKAGGPCRYSKAAYLGYQFSLERQGHSTLTADVLVLVAFDAGRTRATYFVIPAAEIAGRKKLALPTTRPEHYQGQWAQWRDRWETLAEVAAAKGERWVI
ncbi:MAG: hypothetical protein M0R37_11750 [Bacteroidales bacterium]|jgi:hypothetical protein|nr:hypothetical protein [Bacteroidales bacterium]